MKLIHKLEAFFQRKIRQAARAIAVSRDLINPKIGIISQIYKLMIYPDDPPLHMFAAEVARVERYLGRVVGNTGGAGYIHEIGLAAAIGEAIERYSWVSYNEGKMFYGSYNDLRKEGLFAIPPDKFALFSQKQYDSEKFPFKRFTNDLKINWIEGKDLIRGENIFVPAQLVLGGPLRDQEASIGYSTTNGCATGLSFEGAILKGILEVVERDGFTNMWYNKLPVPQLDPYSHPLIKEVFKIFFEPTGVDYHLFDITMNLNIPVVLCVGIDSRHDIGAVQVGAAADLDPVTAALEALKEAGQDRVYAKYLGKLEDQDFSKVRTFEDHVRLWNSTGMIKHLDFLFENKERKKLDELPMVSINEENEKEKLRKILRIFARDNLDLIVVDITPDDIKKIGFKVVKVLAPQLVNIDGDHRFRFLGASRLYKLPQKLGFTNKETSEEDMNPIPHPFP